METKTIPVSDSAYRIFSGLSSGNKRSLDWAVDFTLITLADLLEEMKRPSGNSTQSPKAQTTTKIIPHREENDK